MKLELSEDDIEVIAICLLKASNDFDILHKKMKKAAHMSRYDVLAKHCKTLYDDIHPFTDKAGVLHIKDNDGVENENE